MPRVLIIQAQMKQYRVPFFVKLYDQLRADGIELRVAYSQAPRSERAKRDTSELPDSFGVRVNGYWSSGERFLFQPLLGEVLRAELIIVEHANKHLINHLLLLLRVAGQKRLGFWGLGANKQASRSRFSEFYKRMTVGRADLYFAYTAGVAQEVAEWGVSKERIVSVQNAVDTRGLQTHLRSITDSELEDLRVRYEIMPGAAVGLFCGMLDPVKSIPFLIDCCRIVKQRLQRPFHLILIGGGNDQDTIRSLIRDLPWVHAVGPKFGREKAALFKLAELFLLPGRVGLVILDSFAAGLPLMTVQIPIHGPEVEYLQNGVNGFMAPRNVEAYASSVLRVLSDPDLLLRLRHEAFRSAEEYTVDAMVERFHEGVMRCFSKTTFPKLRYNMDSASL